MFLAIEGTPQSMYDHQWFDEESHCWYISRRVLTYSNLIFILTDLKDKLTRQAEDFMWIVKESSQEMAQYNVTGVGSLVNWILFTSTYVLYYFVVH